MFSIGEGEEEIEQGDGDERNVLGVSPDQLLFEAGAVEFQHVGTHKPGGREREENKRFSPPRVQPPAKDEDRDGNADPGRDQE